MLSNFQNHIEKMNLCTKADKVILAISGGIDSVVMLDLFHRSGYDCLVAHCNFHLRGDESDEDEVFVKKMGEKYGYPVITQDIHTSEYAEEKKISIQMAARELRYNWFDDLLYEQKYNYTAIAHNRDDVVETFLINITRGTGLKGLTGIK